MQNSVKCKKNPRDVSFRAAWNERDITEELCDPWFWVLYVAYRRECGECEQTVVPHTVVKSFESYPDYLHLMVILKQF